MGLWTFDLAERQIMQVRSVTSARACCCCGEIRRGVRANAHACVCRSTCQRSRAG
jgi:hypothetical protein